MRLLLLILKLTEQLQETRENIKCQVCVMNLYILGVRKSS